MEWRSRRADAVLRLEETLSQFTGFDLKETLSTGASRSSADTKEKAIALDACRHSRDAGAFLWLVSGTLATTFVLPTAAPSFKRRMSGYRHVPSSVLRHGAPLCRMRKTTEKSHHLVVAPDRSYAVITFEDRGDLKDGRNPRDEHHHPVVAAIVQSSYHVDEQAATMRIMSTLVWGASSLCCTKR